MQIKFRKFYVLCCYIENNLILIGLAQTVTSFVPVIALMSKPTNIVIAGPNKLYHIYDMLYKSCKVLELQTQEFNKITHNHY